MNRNGTGPEGKGPRTGRGLGNCPPKEDNPSDFPRLSQGGPGRGLGRGLGRGFGRGLGRGLGRRGL